MKRLLIAFILTLLLAAGLGMAMLFDPGYVLLSYGYWTLETSIWIALAAVLALFFVLYVVLRSAFLMWRRSGDLGSWLSNRKYRRSRRQTTAGLIAFIEGRWDRARKTLARAAPRAETPLLNYLMAARASHELDDDEQAQHYLAQAENSTRGAGIAVELTQAELQLANGQLEECLATLERARKNAGRHPSVLKLLQQVYVGLGDWDALIRLLPELRRHKIISAGRRLELEREAYRHLLTNAASDIGKQPATDVNQVWQSLPKELRQDEAMVSHYVDLLIRSDREAEAERQLRRFLKKHWLPQLVAAYGRIAGEDTGLQLKTAETWLRERNNDAVLLLALGRLSLRNRFWGKARDYYESSYKLERTAEVCAELGRLLEHLGEHERSSAYFHEGLLLSAHNLPALPMPEQHRLHAHSKAS